MTLRRNILGLWFVASLWVVLLPLLANESDELSKKLDAARKYLKVSDVVEVDGWVLARGHSRALTQSSASRDASLNKARAEALFNIQKKIFVEALSDEFSAVPSSWRESLTSILERNFNSMVEIKEVRVVESGIENDQASVCVAVPVSAIKGKPADVSIRDLLERIATGKSNVTSSEDADVLYESMIHYRINGARDIWVAANPVLLQSQINGLPVAQGIRLWVENQGSISQLLPDLDEVMDIKNAMIALPFCKDLIDRLAIVLETKGLIQAAHDVANIQPALPLAGFLGQGDDESLKREMTEAGLASNVAIRLIIMADGQYPAMGEEPHSTFEEAFNFFRAGDMSAALPLCVAAFSESYNADTINLLGGALRRCGYNHLGAIICRQALFMNPNHPYAAINTALCYEQLRLEDFAAKYAEIAWSNSRVDAWTKSEAARILKK